MIPDDASTTTSVSTQHHLTDALRPSHQIIDSKDNPQASEPSPTTKGGGTVFMFPVLMKSWRVIARELRRS